MQNLFESPPATRRARAGLAAALGLLLLGVWHGAGSASAQESKGGGSGTLGQSVVRAPVTADLSSVRQMTPEEAAVAKAPPHARGPLSATEYLAAKDKAAKTPVARPGGAAAANVGPAPVRQVGRETPGAAIVFSGQSEQGGVAPSDMALAVSPTWVVQVVNSTISVYDKSGNIQTGFPKSLGAFVGGSGDNGDPRAFYDWAYNRFVVEVDDFTNGLTYMATSATADPRGSWHIYSFAPWGAADCRTNGATCNDFPMIGFDDTTIYLSLNIFPGAGGYSAWMLMLPKSTMYNGGGFSYRYFSNLTFNGVLQDSVQPVSLLTAKEHPRAGFAVNSHDHFANNQCSTACNGIVVWAFSNTLDLGNPLPEASAVLVPTANSYTFPAGGNEPGCAHCVDTGDARISAMPKYHDGKITAALETAGSDAEYHLLWFQLAPTLNDNDPRCTGAFVNRCPQVTGATMINEDCFYCGGQAASGGSYYAALAPDVGGDLTMVYSFSDNNTYPSSVYTGRRATQATNTMHDAGIYMCTSSTTWSGRWGDYNAAAGDITLPSQDYQWFSADNVLSSGNWGSCIGKNGFTNVIQP